MNRDIEIEYDRSILKTAVFSFWKRSIGIGIWIALFICSAAFASMIYNGNRSWIVGAVGVTVMLALIFLISIYVVHYRNTMKKYEELQGSPTLFTIGEDTFGFKSSIGETKPKWSAVQELWKFDKVWLLLFSKAQFVTLPVSSIPVDVQIFLVDRVIESGGRVDS